MVREMDLDRTQYSFQITKTWFRNRNLTTFREKIYPDYHGKKLTYLELGVFEGYSLCWMMQKVLTHPKSKAVAIDPWLQTRKLSEDMMDAVRLRAIHNVIPWKDRCTLIRGNSAEILRRMIYRKGHAGIGPKSVDLALVDGNHNALAVLDDCRLCIKLMKKGGLLIFDDVENDQKKFDHVKQGLSLFLNEQRRSLELAFKHRYIEAYRVLV